MWILSKHMFHVSHMIESITSTFSDVKSTHSKKPSKMNFFKKILNLNIRIEQTYQKTVAQKYQAFPSPEPYPPFAGQIEFCRNLKVSLRSSEVIRGHLRSSEAIWGHLRSFDSPGYVVSIMFKPVTINKARVRTPSWFKFWVFCSIWSSTHSCDT